MLLDDEFTCEARVRFRGQDLAMNKIVSSIDLDDLMPSRGPVNPFDLVDIQQRQERRRRFVDYIASEFAHALTEALFSSGRI